MHEKKNPNKPLIVYYIIALVVVMLLNALLFPQIERYSVKQVDYSEFLSMLDEGKIKSVQIEDTQIAFTPVEQIQDGKATYYTTNRVTADDKLVDRLLAAGVEFGQSGVNRIRSRLKRRQRAGGTARRRQQFGIRPNAGIGCYLHSSGIFPFF